MAISFSSARSDGYPNCEFLRSYCGANLLAHVTKGVCELLGITKLNTTPYYPQCNGNGGLYEHDTEGNVMQICSEIWTPVGPLLTRCQDRLKEHYGKTSHM